MSEGIININGDHVQTLEILFLTTVIALLPSLLVMMTSFTRYIISFSFLRSAIGTQQTPPNIVLIGIALFLTYFTMQPVFAQIRTEAYEPYAAEEISQEEFLSRAEVPLKGFMLRNTKTTTLTMFCDLAHIDVGAEIDTETAMKLPLRVVVPSYDLRIAASFHDWIGAIYSIHADRHCCFLYFDVYGHDYAAAIHDLNALQAASFCYDQWLGTAFFQLSAELSLAERDRKYGYDSCNERDARCSGSDAEAWRSDAASEYAGRCCSCGFAGGDTNS